MKEQKWWKSYDKGVPHTLEPYPGTTLLDAFIETARQKPQETCVIFGGKHITYGEMDRLSDAMGAALAANQVMRGDMVAIILPNSPQFIVAQVGAWKAGAIPVPLNPLYTADELRSGINQSGAKVAVVYSPLYRAVKSLQSLHPRMRMVIAADVEGYPNLVAKSPTFTAGPDSEGRPATLHIGDAWLTDLLSKYANSQQPPVKVSGDDVALILQSGGTIGIPRGIMLTHKALLAEAMQIRAWLKPVLADREDIILLNLPLFHVFGNAALMSTAILGRYPMALVPDPRNHDDMINIIQKVHPAIFAGVPTLFSGLMKDPAVISKAVDFSSVKLAVSGAAPLSADIKERFTQLTGIRLIQGYGLTETSAAIICEPAGKTGKPGSIGIPLPDVAVKIVDTETGRRDLTSGQEGEIIVKCPQVMLGFYNSLEETAEMLRDGWLYTGDVGYLDKDGYIFITARKKELIKVSGFQVWPQEVVAVIKAHPAVEDVCVRGIPDPLQGESVKAWIVLKKGQHLSGEELRAHCRQKLTAYKIPRHVEFRDDLPRSPYGQQLCRKLVEEEKAKTASGV